MQTNFKDFAIARPRRYLAIALCLALAGCDRRPVAENPGAAPQAIATIQEIVAEPVWVSLGERDPIPAQPSQPMAYGDRIRTENQSLAEVGLINGAVFRIGGNATLTLRPSQLQLEAGQMITWVEGETTEPLEIVTPAGIAGIRGTTVFVNIGDDPAAPIEIFSWEGQVAFRLSDGGEEILLNSGDQLLVSPGEADVDALRQRVQPLDRPVAQRRLQESALINGFVRPIPTRPAIEATVETLE